ncbi:Pyridoxal kinase [Frankliniella fusca]|uniref:Pyridoxal kinase n=1 Tax=Frankliniella fusca TaxID=407009 RepID=A0AAE1H3L1_9NEOP|nr:Pyridoxal kinase [Frankliniella fusca]
MFSSFRNGLMILCLRHVNTAALGRSVTSPVPLSLAAPRYTEIRLNFSRLQCLFSPCTTMGDSSPRVLSIQSHVVSGYVGNKSATFPLQVLGFDVDAINSVQFSNHTGYGYWKGHVLAEQELVELAEGLAHNGLDRQYTHLLTGYNRSKSFLSHIANIVCELRKKNPGLIYLCDPVIGDIGRGVYVPQDLIEVYQKTIIPIANVVTPNQFELEILTGKPVKSIEDAWEATALLHNMGPRTVVVSSSELGNEDSLLCLGSMIVEGKRKKAMVTFPKLEGSYTGTGDLFSALFLAWMWRSGQDLKQSLEFTVATIQAILQQTIALKKGSKWPYLFLFYFNVKLIYISFSLENNDKSVFQNELKLIQGKSDIENPKVIYPAVLLE